MTELAPPAAESRSSGHASWLILIIAGLAQFMVVLDITVVNIALPSIQKGLSFSSSNLQWVVNGYTLIFGGFLLLGGRAADLLGRKRLFMIGILVFAAASLLNGLAQSSGMLIVGRGLQGLGGALVSPAALSIVTTTYTEGDQRTKALASWSAISAAGSALGLLLGGVLTDIASWRWVFFINVPIGLAAILLAVRFVSESRAESVRRYDVAGALTVTGGLVVLVYAIVKAQAYGWGSAHTIIGFAIAVALLAAFVVIEQRTEQPLMRLGIFRVRSLAVGDAALLLVGSAMFGMFYFASLYVQDILHDSPLTAGLVFLPVTGGIMIASGVAQQTMQRVGLRNVAAAGAFIGAIGLLILTRLPVHGRYVEDLLPGLLPLAFGIGLVFVPVTVLATSGVEASDAGLASGLFNVAQQVGGSLGLAILATVATSQTNHLVKIHSLHGPLAARVSGYHMAFLVAAIFIAAAGALLVLMLRRSHTAEIERELAESGGAVAVGA